MILSIDSSNQSAHRAVLDAMFEARKQVFVDLLGWELDVAHGRYEIDAFDDEHAQYLVVADDDRRHLGSARILPTTRAHILGDLFPDLCDQPPPRGPHIYEITRFCLGRGLGAARRRCVRDTLVMALAHHALARRIASYTGVAEIGWLRQIERFGWHYKPLGNPRRRCGMTLGALRIDIAAGTPDLLARAGITASGEAALLLEAA